MSSYDDFLKNKRFVLDPFAGIGSSPYVALTLNRRGIGFELKQSYFEQMKNNLEIAAHESETMGGYPVGQMNIFDFLGENASCVNIV